MRLRPILGGLALASGLTLGCLFATGSANAQALEVTPSRVLLDESATIRATGLPPHGHVTLRGELVDGAGHPWSSEAEFVVTPDGVVDTAKQAPAQGSYRIASAMGLVWSMRPTEKKVGTYTHPAKFAAQPIAFRLLINGREVSSAPLEQQNIAAGVRIIRLEGYNRGILFEPDAPGPHPGVMVLGGSEGGVPYDKASWLASHGYAALALAYFHYEDLPPTLESIPLEYFANAIDWFTAREEVQRGGIAVVGTSRGGELALQLAAINPTIRAVIAYAPSNIRHPSCCNGAHTAWTLRGQPLAYVDDSAADAPENPLAVMNATIPVEDAKAPILLISGQDDGVLRASMMSELIVSRLKQTHYAFPVEHLKYTHAGHRAGRPEIVPLWMSAVLDPTSGRSQHFGGTVEGDALSSLDAIPRVLAFLCQNLQSCQAQK